MRSHLASMHRIGHYIKSVVQNIFFRFPFPIYVSILPFTQRASNCKTSRRSLDIRAKISTGIANAPSHENTE
jgi:hypothetical protein